MSIPENLISNRHKDFERKKKYFPNAPEFAAVLAFTDKGEEVWVNMAEYVTYENNTRPSPINNESKLNYQNKGYNFIYTNRDFLTSLTKDELKKFEEEKLNLVDIIKEKLKNNHNINTICSEVKKEINLKCSNIDNITVKCENIINRLRITLPIIHNTVNEAMEGKNQVKKNECPLIVVPAGLPGSGKTSSMSYIVEDILRLQEDTCVIASLDNYRCRGPGYSAEIALNPEDDGWCCMSLWAIVRDRIINRAKDKYNLSIDKSGIPWVGFDGNVIIISLVTADKSLKVYEDRLNVFSAKNPSSHPCPTSIIRPRLEKVKDAHLNALKHVAGKSGCKFFMSSIEDNFEDVKFNDMLQKLPKNVTYTKHKGGKVIKDDSIIEFNFDNCGSDEKNKAIELIKSYIEYYYENIFYSKQKAKPSANIVQPQQSNYNFQQVHSCI